MVHQLVGGALKGSQKKVQNGREREKGEESRNNQPKVCQDLVHRDLKNKMKIVSKKNKKKIIIEVFQYSEVKKVHFGK